MSDTRHRHAPINELRRYSYSAREAIRREAAEAGVHTKPHKQRRVNERVKLRKEYLP
jgi:hypothetical protein